MKKVFSSLFLVALCFGLSGATVQIAADSKSNYVIVIPDEAAPVLKNAAKELADWLGKATNVQYPVYAESERPSDRPAFLIGTVKAAKKLPKFDFSKAPLDTTAIRFVGKDIYLNGKMPRGPLYAVYTFLENYVGIRWWNDTEFDVPSKSELAVEAKNYRYSPQVVSRDDAYTTMAGYTAVRNKVNGHFSKIPAEWGGNMHLLGWCHTFGQIIPPDKYFKDHPEWFAEINGKRVARDKKRNDPAQLCLTNEEMTKEFIRVLMNNIAKNPNIGLVSVSQNDQDSPCTCAKCKAVVAAEGAQSGPIVHFVNKVAAEVKKKYPDLLVETLAYSYSRKAPKKVRAADNVVIRLCCIESNFSQPVTHPSNASFARDVREWSKIAKNLYIWNYSACFGHYLLPYPNWRGYLQDIPFYAKHNMTGLFQNGDYFTRCGDFIDARAWICAKQMWEPHRNPREIQKEFFDGYYGPAGKHLIDYIDFLCDTVDRAQWRYSCYYGSVLAWLDPVSLNKAIRIFTLAEKAVADKPLFAERVRRARITLDVACLERLPEKAGWKRYCRLNILPDLKKTPEQLIAEFRELGKRYEPEKSHFSESGPSFETLAKVMEGRIKNAPRPYDGPTPPWCKGLPKYRWDHFAPNPYNLPAEVAPGVGLRRFDFYMPNRFEIPRNEGKWVSFVNDPASFSKTVAKIIPNHNNPSSRMAVYGYYGKKKWKFRIRLRCEGSAPRGDVLKIGFNSHTPSSRFSMTVKGEKIVGSKYAVVETPAVVIGATPDQYIWFAPVKRSDVSAVYIDCITMIREP